MRVDEVDAVVCLRHHEDRKSTRLNSSHVEISYAVFCLKKKKNEPIYTYIMTAYILDSGKAASVTFRHDNRNCFYIMYCFAMSLRACVRFRRRQVLVMLD